MGIGQGISRRLAEVGATVVIVDINLDEAKNTAKSIMDKGGKARPIKVDVSNVKEIKNVVETIIKEFGHIDILVNNAAIYPMVSMMELTEEMWGKVMNITLKGTYFFLKQ